MNSSSRIRFPGALWFSFLVFSGNVGADPGSYLKKPGAWFGSDEARRIAEHVLSWQAPDGTWPKNGDTGVDAFEGDVAALKGTFDNGATRDEIRLLGRVAAATGDERIREAALRGIDAIIAAQGPLGGWPQSASAREHYPRHITLNDGTMVGLLGLLREIAESGTEDGTFGWVDAGRREAAGLAVERGIECLLDCQVVVGGRRTAWCAQHDERNLRPRPARSFELVSLSGGESADILTFLMRHGEPTARMVGAIEDGVAWFEAVRISGLREEKRDGNKVMVEDKDAPSLWARFYEIGSNRPIFAGRDGVKRYRIDEIEYERRNGYSWYGSGGKDVARAFEKWKRKWPARPAPAPARSRDPFAPPLVVAEDGSGDFRSVGEAVAFAPANSTEAVAIYLEPGEYREVLVVPENKPGLRLIGRDPGHTRLVTRDAGSVAMTVLGDRFSAVGVGFRHEFGPGAPASALRVRADRVVFRDCRFEGWQETVLLERGRQYFEDCTISGHIDFVAGEGQAWFERCALYCRARGTITGASTPEDSPMGFVFAKATISAARGVAATSLGRARGSHARVIFLQSELPKAIRSNGWDPEGGAAARFAEFGNSGPGAARSQDPPLVPQLREAEARALKAENVLGGKDGWNPVLEASSFQAPPDSPQFP